MFKWNIYKKLLIMFISLSIIISLLVNLFNFFGLPSNIYIPFLVWICAMTILGIIIPNRNDFLNINMTN